MGNFNAVLFDVDGVIVRPPKLFAEIYCEQYGVNPAKQVEFYDSKEFQDATIGKFDLADAIRLHNDKWQWNGEPQELITRWLEAENHIDQSLMDVIERARLHDIPVYLATQQEDNRAAYLRDVMFPDKFDGIFCSNTIGFHKHEIEFWNEVISQLYQIDPEVRPEDIIYFDDKQIIVDTAAKVGIQAYLYEDFEQVQNLLSL